MQVSQVPFRIDTFKSLATEKETKEGVINYQIGGCISTEQLDKQGEEIIQKGIDFATYAPYRRLKWEHDNSPKANIGFAEKIELRKGGVTYMNARIFAQPGTPQYKVAQEAVGDIQNILAYNSMYPKNKKDLGFSVEGGKLAKSGTKVTKSIVTNVVLTTCPINTGAVVDFFKSFIAGTESNPLTMTGSGALRTEHLDGNLSTNIKNQMKNIKNKDEAVSFYKSQGKTETEAKELADQWEVENNGRLQISKSISDSIEKLEKAVVDNSDIGAKIRETSYTAMTKSFKDSLTPDGENRINPANVMAESTNVQIELAKSQLSRDAEIVKSNGIVLEAIKGNIELMKSLVDSLNQIKDDNSVILQANDELAKSIQKLDGGVSTENLEKENIAGGEEGAAGEAAKPAFDQGQVVHALKKSSINLYDQGKKIESDECDKMLGTAQLFNYNMAAEGFPENIKRTVEDYYRAGK